MDTLEETIRERIKWQTDKRKEVERTRGRSDPAVTRLIVYVDALNWVLKEMGKNPERNPQVVETGI